MLMQNKPLILIAGLVVIIGGYLAFNYSPLEKNTKEEEKVTELPLVTEEVVTTEASPAFSWRFAVASTNNPDGNPQTEVYLTASYEDKSKVEKLVDTVDGGCSLLEGESYDSDVSNTGKVQCYYAGLGQQYRIIENESSYTVERKLFEESLPDYVPPESLWEVIQNLPKRFI